MLTLQDTKLENLVTAAKIDGEKAGLGMNVKKTNGCFKTRRWQHQSRYSDR